MYPFLFLTIILTGCSTLPAPSTPVKTNQTSQERFIQLQLLQQWDIQGKIAYIDDNNRNSAALTWQVNEKTNVQTLNLSTYLGINVLQLNSTNGNHTIHVDGKTYQGTNLDALIYSLTGLPLPTKALTYWLKGLPYQQSDTIIYDGDTALPKSLSSNYNNGQWKVNYSKYEQVNEYTLATKFSIEKDDLTIRIAINKWTVN